MAESTVYFYPLITLQRSHNSRPTAAQQPCNSRAIAPIFLERNVTSEKVFSLKYLIFEKRAKCVGKNRGYCTAVVRLLYGRSTAIARPLLG